MVEPNGDPRFLVKKTGFQNFPFKIFLFRDFQRYDKINGKFKRIETRIP